MSSLRNQASDKNGVFLEGYKSRGGKMGTVVNSNRPASPPPIKIDHKQEPAAKTK
jgi:hypothetical protein